MQENNKEAVHFISRTHDAAQLSPLKPNRLTPKRDFDLTP